MTRPRSGRGALSRDEIVTTARDLVRADGLDALTMPRVAEALQVTTMAVYYHVPTKDDLIALVHDSVVAEAGPIVLGNDGWQASLRRSLLALWSAYRRYPGLAMWRIGRPDMPGTDEYDRNVGFFEAAGFSPRDSALAWSLVATYLFGRLSVEGASRSARRRGPKELGARDYIEFSVEALIAGIATACPSAPHAERDGPGL